MTLSLDEIRASLAEYLAAHESSSIVEKVDGDGKKIIAIEKPWDDDSINIIIPNEHPQDLLDALNSVLFNYRLPAIYHKDTAKLEIIWTAYPVQSGIFDVVDRTFTFTFKQKTYVCSFSTSSKRLIEIAARHEVVRFSETQGRNLDSYKLYHDAQGHEDLFNFEMNPRSFWIEGISFDESMFEIINHLNFYIGFYDKSSPIVQVHSPKREKSGKRAFVRYAYGEFPRQFAGTEIDDNLLHYWNAARYGDPSRRFIYYFRILEYCASVYIDYSTRLAVKKVLLLPNALDNISMTEEKVVSALHQYRTKDFQRMEAMLREAVEPEILWTEVSHNIEALSVAIEFDGGFKLKPFAKTSWTQADFNINAIESFNSSLHQIRNALSHGKDQSTALVILPTERNFELLLPWVALSCAAAAHIMLFRRSL